MQDEVIGATNGMFWGVNREGEPDREALIRFAHRGCDVLRRVLGTGRLSGALHELHTLRNLYEVDVRTMLRDPEQLDRFLGHEALVLLEAGMAPLVVDSLITRARDVLMEVAADELPPREVLGAVSELADYACSSARSIEDNHRRRQRVRKLAYSLGGVAICLVNGGAATALFGLPVPVAVASGAVGGALIFKERLSA